VARKWLNADSFKDKPQFSKRHWAETLEALDALRHYESISAILDDFVAEVSAAAAAAAIAAIGTGSDKGGAPAGPPSGSSDGASSSSPPALSAGEGGVTGGGGPAGPPSGSSAGASSAATSGPPSGSSADASSAATPPVPPVHHQAPAQAQTPLQLLMVPARLVPSGFGATGKKAPLDAAICARPACLPSAQAGGGAAGGDQPGLLV
jgi:hypothetical protein